MEISVFCQICSERIAVVDTERLSYPMIGAMFQSPDPAHGYPDPFAPSLDWEAMRCPYGPHRPFLRDDQILTPAGLINLPQETQPATLEEEEPTSSPKYEKHKRRR